jgi:hypothetical protein
MGKPRFTAFAIALWLLCGLAAREALAAGEVRVVRASSRLLIDTLRVSDSAAAADSNSAQQIELTLLIKNLAYEKAVQLLIKNDTAWDTVNCNWIRQADDDHEYWMASKRYSREPGQPAPRDLEFKLRYVVTKKEFFDDNGGNNYKLAKNGGTLLPGNAVLLKKCQWEKDTGAFTDSSVFMVEAEVRGWKTGGSLTAAFSPDNMKSQGFYTAQTDPVPTWLGAAPADSGAVRLYAFRVTGIRTPFSALPVLNFHLKYWDGAKDWRDDNLGNRYAIMLGSRLVDMTYEELPIPVTLGRRAERRYISIERKLRVGSSPVYQAGSRGLIDGMGRSR